MKRPIGCCIPLKAAREDVTLVMQNLEEQGYHLHMPPGPIRAELDDGA